MDATRARAGPGHASISAAPFTECAWRFRHRGDAFEPDGDEVTTALGIADRVVEAIAALVAG